jgi:hypothetical protein
VQLTLTSYLDGLLDTEHPGVPGLLARGERAGLEAMARAVDARAELREVTVDGPTVTATFVVDPAASPADPPGEVGLMQSLASGWVFQTTR